MADPKVARYLGVGLEATMGTAVAADVHIDIASASLDSPTDTIMPYEGGLARSPRTMRPGPYVSQGGIEYAFDVETVGHLLILAFGGNPVVTGPDGDGHYTYTMKPSLRQIMRTGTFRVGKDLFEHVFPGCAVGGFTLSIERGYAMLSADIVGGKDQKDTLKAVSALLLPDAYPEAFHDLTISLGGTDRSATIEKVELGFNNNADGEGGIGMGSRFPRYIYAGELECTLGLTMAFHDLGEKEKFWGSEGATEPGTGAAFDEPAILSFDAGDFGSLDFVIPRLSYTEVPIQPSGRDRITQEIKARALFDEDTAAEITATLVTGTNITNAVLASLS